MFFMKNMLIKSKSKKVYLDQVGKFFPWIVWGIAVSFYFFQYFARVSIGGMTKPLMHDLSVDAVGIGFIGASFYIAYVPMQFFAGIFFVANGYKRLLRLIHD